MCFDSEDYAGGISRCELRTLLRRRASGDNYCPRL